MNSDSGAVEFELGSADCPRSSANCDLYWFHKQKLHVSEGSFEGKPLDGTYTSFYIDGQLKEKGKFRCGMRTGEWKRWWPNGRISHRTPYSKGDIEGKQLLFSDDSKLLSKRSFRNGLRHGRSIDYSSEKTVITIFRNGNEVSSKEKSNKKDNQQDSETENHKEPKKKKTKRKRIDEPESS